MLERQFLDEIERRGDQASKYGAEVLLDGGFMAFMDLIRSLPTKSRLWVSVNQVVTSCLDIAGEAAGLDLQGAITTIEQDGGYYLASSRLRATPSLIYSVGCARQNISPELVVSGLNVKNAQMLIATVLERFSTRDVDIGEPFKHEKSTYIFKRFDYASYQDQLPLLTWYYSCRPVPIYQIIWPDGNGGYPWDKETQGAVNRYGMAERQNLYWTSPFSL